MILDRLGVISDEVSPDLTTALDWVKREALSHVEIRMVDGVNVLQLNDEQLKRVRSEVDERGLKVSAVASGIFKCALDPSRPVASGDVFGQKEESVEAHFGHLDRVIQIAKILGTQLIRVFSFWRENNPAAHEEEIVAHLRKAAAIAEKAGVLLMQENEGSCNGGFAAEVAHLVRRVGSPAMRALWDPGNENYYGRTAFPEGYQSVRKELAHVHLKDVVRAADGTPTCVPLGSGDVKYPGQFRALVEDAYAGYYTLETHYVPEGGTKMDGTKESLEGLRRLLREGGLE